MQKSNKRNQSGVKDSANMYRTIGGEHFVCWTAGEGSAQMARRLRAAGVRARFIAGEVFIHHADQVLAGGAQ